MEPLSTGDRAELDPRPLGLSAAGLLLIVSGAFELLIGGALIILGRLYSQPDRLPAWVTVEPGPAANPWPLLVYGLVAAGWGAMGLWSGVRLQMRDRAAALAGCAVAAGSGLATALAALPGAGHGFNPILGVVVLLHAAAIVAIAVNQDWFAMG